MTEPRRVKTPFPRLERLTRDETVLVDGMRRLMRDTRDWSRPRPRELNARVFADEIRQNRRVEGWIRAGNVWLDGRMTVRDPYGATDIRLHACDKLYGDGGEYCEILGHYGCNECWRMTQRKCAERDLPKVDYEVLRGDRPLSASWKVISQREKALKNRAMSARSELSSTSSKLEKILSDTNKISDTLLEEKRSFFMTEPPPEPDNLPQRRKSSVKPEKERYVFKNDLKLMCPPLMSIYQAKAEVLEYG